MTTEKPIALRKLILKDKDSSKTAVVIQIYPPVQIPNGDYTCKVKMEGFQNIGSPLHGVDSLQALSLAIKFTKQLLTYFVEDGGKIFNIEGNEISIDEYNEFY